VDGDDRRIELEGIVAIDPDGIPWHAGSSAGVRYKVVSDDSSGPARMQIAHYEPGWTHPAHSHPEAEALFILEGELFIGELKATRSMTVFIDKDTMYGPLTAGPEGAVFLRIGLP
jgi:hypothetical protein